jgi:protein OS-9
LQYEVVFSKSYIHAEKVDELLARKHVASVPHLNTNDGQSAFETNGDISIRQGAEQLGYGKPSDDRDSYELIVLNDREYLCTIPYVAPPAPDNGTAIPKEEQQHELARATEHGLEVLKEMQGQCIYYPAGWWMYSFCYNEGIRQFHPLPPGRGGVPIFPPVEDRNVHSYLLGQFPKTDSTPVPSGQSDEPTSSSTDLSSSTASSTSALVTSHGTSNYLVQTLTDGTLCDLTNKPRRIEIQYHCNPSNSDRIAMIKETASCVYLMVIHTPRLCNDVVFQPPQLDRPEIIACQEVISSPDEEEAWQRRVSREAEAFLRGETERTAAAQAAAAAQQDGTFPDQQQQKPLVVGGITVGGRQLAGATPETTIKASNIIVAASQRNSPASGIAAEKFIATLAKSDGRYTSSLAEAEMQKLGLKGTKDELEKWIEEMRDLAGEGVAWKLDVVRTATGMEFRGIVLDDTPDESKKEDEQNKGTAPAAGDVTPPQKGHKAGEQAEPVDEVGDEVGSEEEYK